MSMLKYTLLALFVIFVVLGITNPDVNKHTEEWKKDFQAQCMKDESHGKLCTSNPILCSEIINWAIQYVNIGKDYKDYTIFSFLGTDYDYKRTIGFLKNVWIVAPSGRKENDHTEFESASFHYCIEELFKQNRLRDVILITTVLIEKNKGSVVTWADGLYGKGAYHRHRARCYTANKEYALAIKDLAKLGKAKALNNYDYYSYYLIYNDYSSPYYNSQKASRYLELSRRDETSAVNDSRHVLPGSDNTESMLSQIDGGANENSSSYSDDGLEKVKIGSQIWMKKNLNVTRFNNGDEILSVYDHDGWKKASMKKQPANFNFSHNQSNVLGIGRLYNWYAVNDSRGLCPVGWHVATDTDWKTLAKNLGGIKVAGTKMIDPTVWDFILDGNSNSSGFSGLGGGSINNDYGILMTGAVGEWWTSTKYMKDSAWTWRLMPRDPDDSSGLSRDSNYFGDGFSVRCVKD